MIDPIQIVRQWLLASSSVGELAGTDIFGEAMPEHYDPTSNPCVVLNVKGGAGHVEIAPIMEVEIQVTCWAGVNQFVLARSLYGACYDTMHSQSMVVFAGYGTVETSYEMSTGRGDVDVDSGWARVMGAFHLLLRQDQAITLPTWVDDTQTAQEYLEGLFDSITGVDGNGNFS